MGLTGGEVFYALPRVNITLTGVHQTPINYEVLPP